jgi:hypothetical protein
MEGAVPDWSANLQVPENPFGLNGSVQAVTEFLLAAAQTQDVGTNTGGVRTRPVVK